MLIDVTDNKKKLFHVCDKYKCNYFADVSFRLLDIFVILRMY